MNSGLSFKIRLSALPLTNCCMIFNRHAAAIDEAGQVYTWSATSSSLFGGSVAKLGHGKGNGVDTPT